MPSMCYCLLLCVYFLFCIRWDKGPTYRPPCATAGAKHGLREAEGDGGLSEGEPAGLRTSFQRSGSLKTRSNKWEISSIDLQMLGSLKLWGHWSVKYSVLASSGHGPLNHYQLIWYTLLTLKLFKFMWIKGRGHSKQCEISMFQVLTSKGQGQRWSCHVHCLLGSQRYEKLVFQLFYLIEGSQQGTKVYV